jgi:hypothetical protein
MVLRIWYPRPRQICRHTAERVAIRLAPALETWFKDVYSGDPSLDFEGRDQRVPRLAPAANERSALV